MQHPFIEFLKIFLKAASSTAALQNFDLSVCFYRPRILLVGAGDHTGPQPNRPLYTPKQNGFFGSALHDTVFDGFRTYRSSDVILIGRSESKNPLFVL